MGGNLAAIPKIPLAAHQPFRARGHEHFVGGLRLAAFLRAAGLQYPTQSWRSDVDAQGICEILATQSHGGHVGAGRFRLRGIRLPGPYRQDDGHRQDVYHNKQSISIRHSDVLLKLGP